MGISIVANVFITGRTVPCESNIQKGSFTMGRQLVLVVCLLEVLDCCSFLTKPGNNSALAACISNFINKAANMVYMLEAFQMVVL